MLKGVARLRQLCNELKFDYSWIDPSAGKTSCLALFWKKSVKVNVVSSSPNHIDAIIGESSEVQWRFIGVYGFADKSRKHETWSFLRDFHSWSPLPWMCAGDFNEILWSHKKLGLGIRQEGMMKEYRDALDECGLMEFGCVGKKITWRGKWAGSLVLERLDRAVANNGWFSLYPGIKVQHLGTYSLDHRAILIKLEGIIPRPDRPFKFEHMWLHEDGCRNTVNNVWGSTSRNASMVQIAAKIKICGEKLLD